MNRIGTSIAALSAVLGVMAAHAQSPGASQRDLPSTQPHSNPGETTGSTPRSQQDLGPNNVVPPDGATDRAPPSKLKPGELPPPQNPKR